MTGIFINVFSTILVVQYHMYRDYNGNFGAYYCMSLSLNNLLMSKIGIYFNIKYSATQAIILFQTFVFKQVGISIQPVVANFMFVARNKINFISHNILICRHKVSF